MTGGLQRWGFNRSGLPQQQADGFWTPWNEANAAAAAMRLRIGKLRAALLVADTDEAHAALEADDAAVDGGVGLT